MIKVCGMGVVSALGIGCEENLRALVVGVCSIAQKANNVNYHNLPVGALTKSNQELQDLLCCSKVATVSRTALLGAIAAKEAVLNANIPQGKRVGLISSNSVGGMDVSEQMSKEKMAAEGEIVFSSEHDCSCSTKFIAQQCGINGFTTTISTACSSAANAIIMGAHLLQKKMLDYVVVGGTDALSEFTINGFNSLMILDNELCKPMDIERKGLNLGEGAAYLVLTKEKAPAKHYCNLSGFANANDAFHQTASSNHGEGAFRAMQQALQMANLQTADIDYIHLHGTGTQNNDSSEWAAVQRLFSEATPYAASTKGYTGHTLAAAGAVAAVFSILALNHNVCFPNLRCENPIDNHPSILCEVLENKNLSHVLSNSFGFGGNCSSLIFSR